MSKTEETLSGEQIREWATKDFVIGEISNISTNARNDVLSIAEHGIFFSANRQSSHLTVSGQFPIRLNRFLASNNRKIGYIAGTNSDNSYHLYIFGDDTFDFNARQGVLTQVQCNVDIDLVIRPPESQQWTADDILNYMWQTVSGVYTDRRTGLAYNNFNLNGFVSEMDSFEFHPSWSNVSFNPMCFVDCGQLNNQFIYDTQGLPHSLSNVNLTTNLNTLQIGVPLSTKYFQRSMSGMFYGDKNVGGDLFDLMNSFTQSLNTSIRNLPIANVIHTEEINNSNFTFVNTYPYWEGSFAYHYTPYNLILTYNKDEAIRYIETGELPSDAFLYPFDVDNIPINETGGTGAEDSDGTQADDSISTGGDSGGEDTDDQTTEAPTNTPQALTNNNLYWLTSTQLKNFIEWFWTDATDVTDPQELFEKIQGLYSDLSQAIVSIRYMPIDADWIGGTTIENSIIVGLVEKTGQVRTINKTVAPVRDITPNDVDISELPDFKGFINFSPYCEISLYLPFYGYLSMDADLLMQNKLRIKATYDILSGTIQYYIFRVSSKTGDATMINTVTGKMAVDIPISLQTKNERDSMIFNNVASATANLIGAGASAVAGNPIGMVMSTSAIAGQQSQGAPMRVMGTIGESGAFYDHGHCAIFIKRPATNYPPQYARRVGYPYNGARKLEKTHGFVQCFNPYIEFTHMTVNDNDIQPPKPTAEEIETIYNALTDGVILP